MSADPTTSPTVDAATAAELAEPDKAYRTRWQRFGALRDHYARLSDRNGNVNVALAVAALACLGLGIWRGAGFYWLAGLFAVAFVAAYIALGRVNALQRGYAERCAMCDEGLARRRRDWAALPLPPLAATDGTDGTDGADAAAPLAGDLDLLGRASLEHLLGTAGTPMGRETVRRWILTAAPPDVIRRRQRAVAELAPLLDFREDLAVRGRLVGTAQPSYGEFVRWAEADRWLTRPDMAWLVWLIRALTLLTLALMAAQAVGAVRVPWWLILVTINGVVSAIYWRRLEAEIRPVESLRNVCLAYAELFQAVGAQPTHAEELVRIRGVLAGPGASAEGRMRALARITTLATLRRSILYGAIQLVTLLGFHTAWLVARWRARSGAGRAAWLAALGELETLAALAALAFDHPDWTFPKVVGMKEPQRSQRTQRDEEGSRKRETAEPAEDAEVRRGEGSRAERPDKEGSEPESTVVEGRALGHPLLPPATCVRNDVRVGPSGTFLLVTGSNMSGKSTLLRAIGVNVVLAQAGGPVCAAAMRLPPVRLATAIRVRDSLEEGISYFLAELRRLREIVAEADASRDPSTPRVLYLLDEILHGTNTAERQIAARRIVRHLVAQGAVGAVSTHDLTLADAPALARLSVPVHFTETLVSGDAADGRPIMRFDYILRPGIATSTNALRLMEAVGLNLDDEDDAVD